MVTLRRRHLGWLTAILILLTLGGVLWLNHHLGQQIAHRVHATTVQLNIATLGVEGDASLVHSMFSSNSLHSLNLNVSNTHELRIEHVILYGPLRFTHTPKLEVTLGAAWIDSTIHFPAQHHLPPLQVKTHITYSGKATSRIHYNPISLNSLDESLEWQGMTGLLVYHRLTREMSAVFSLGAMESRSSLAHAFFGGAQISASGPINRFSGHRSLQVSLSPAYLHYLQDHRRYAITGAVATLDSVDQSPHSTVRFKTDIKQIDAAGQLFEQVRVDLTLERIAAALLLETEPSTLLDALSLLLAHKPTFTLDAGVNSPSGPADAYLKVSAGPFGLGFITGNVIEAFLNTVAARGQLTLPRPLLESIFRQQFRSLEQDNALLRDDADTLPLNKAAWAEANARSQLSLMEANSLVLPVNGALTSDLTLNQGTLTINQRQFDLFSLLLPFLE